MNHKATIYFIKENHFSTNIINHDLLFDTFLYHSNTMISNLSLFEGNGMKSKRKQKKDIFKREFYRLS